MIEKEYIDYLKNKFKEYENYRDRVIEKSIKINRLSKSIIYSIIRGDIDSANKYIEEINNYKKEVDEILKLEPRLYNNVVISFQEYAEALIFYNYIINKKIIKNKDINVDENSYVLGLMDFVGELYRKSVEEMLKNNLSFAEEARNIIYDIYKNMLYMEFKNYDIRRKVDYVGEIYNLLTDKIFIRKSSRTEN
ncbi:translin [Nanobdella aerobiophila]|uniref:Translin n=1 Tax=Nanobdella aerobiophila TaxID=2586965 RepID=A0A915SKR3_9ARCH|nr:haloacid dehalogenase [Nanobdella aerobiophila]BBL45818.1 translin [Nanobdella aerobiophila]